MTVLMARRFPPLLLMIFLFSLLPQEARASHIEEQRTRTRDYTRCEREFVTLPDYTYDPFGYRYTRDLNLIGIGRKRRLAECDYLLSRRVGRKRIGIRTLDRSRIGRVSGDFSRIITELLRERQGRRRPLQPRILDGAPHVVDGGPTVPVDELLPPTGGEHGEWFHPRELEREQSFWRWLLF
jgi:hypothetical protein